MADEVLQDGIENDPKTEILARFNKSIGLAPALDKVNYPSNPGNPLPPTSLNIMSEIKGSPFTGIDPGLKTNGSTENYAKAIGDFLGKTASTPEDPRSYMKLFSFNGDYDGANFERYYNTKQFNTIGFNPYRDNESLYNEKRTFGDDFVRAAGQWPSLLKSGFMSGIRAWGDMFSDPLAPDLKSAGEMEKAMAIGSSSKGGVGGFFTNTFLNSAYTVGIGADLLLEELALAGVTALSGGTLGEMTLPAMLTSATKAGRIFKVGEESVGAMTNLNKMSDLRTFWETTGKGASKLASAINPLENTFQIGKELSQGANALKYTKATGKIDEFARWSDNFGGFAKDMLLIKSAVSESKLEGGMVQLNTIRQLSDEYRATHDGAEPQGEEMVKIENIAKDEAKRTALWNMPAILWSNKLMYETVFAPFEKVGKNAIKDIVFDATAKGVGKDAIRKGAFVSVGEGVMDKARTAGKTLLDPKTYGKFAAGYMKTNFAEGIQENIQEAISHGAINHAKDLYTHPDRGPYETFMGHFLKGAKEQFSAQGAETFAGGFLMGSMAQPMMGAPMFAFDKIKQNTWGKNDYTAYKKNRNEQLYGYIDKNGEKVPGTIDYLNELYQDPMKYFAPDIDNLMEQNELAVDMHQAIRDADKNQIRDIEDVASFRHIYTALSTGHFDKIMDTFQNLKQLTPKEAADTWHLPDEKAGAKALAKLDDVINRANGIKSNYNETSANFPNPYNPNRFDQKTNPEDYNAQAYAYQAWERAKLTLVFGKQSFIDHSKRLEEMAAGLSSTSKPLAKASAQDIMVLLDPKTTMAKIKSLSEDIKGLDPAISGHKQLIKDKETERELLRDIHFSFNREEQLRSNHNQDVLKRALAAAASGKTNKRVLKKDIKATKKIETADATSREVFSDYLKHLAKVGGDFFFDEKMNNAYDIIRDHALVKDEMEYLVESINVLNNPKGFLRLSSDIQRALIDIHEKSPETVKKNVETAAIDYEANKGVNDFMKKTGLTITPEYWNYFVDMVEEHKEPDLPTEFIDPRTQLPTTDEKKIAQAIEVWKDNLEMIRREVPVEVTSEAKPGIKPVVAEATTPAIITPVSKKIDSRKTPLEAYPELLSQEDTVKIFELVDTYVAGLNEARDSSDQLDEEDNKDLYDIAVKEFLATNPEVLVIVKRYNQTVEPVVKSKVESTLKQRSLDEVKFTTKSDLDIYTTTLYKPDGTTQMASGTGLEGWSILEKEINDFYEKPVITTKAEGTNPAQNKALVAVDKLKNIVEAVEKDALGYTIKLKGITEPIRYNTRVSGLAGKIAKYEFNFADTDMGKSMVVMFQDLKKSKAFSPEAVVEAIKMRPAVTKLFTDDKLVSLQEGLTEDSSKENFIKLIEALAYSESAIRGNTIDEMGRKFLSTGSVSKEDFPNISQEAFDKVVSMLQEFKAKIEAEGGIIITNDLVLFGIPESQGKEEGIAGEADILVINKAGNFEIYDMKTIDSPSKYLGKKALSYATQLSLYQNLLENFTKIPVVKRELLMFKTKTKTGTGYIESVDDVKRDIADKDLILDYQKSVEQYVPKRIGVTVTQTESRTTSILQGIKIKINNTTDISSLENVLSSVEFIQAQERLIDLATELEVEETDLTSEYIQMVDDLVTQKQQELLMNSNDINNLNWAKAKGKTVNFEVIDGAVGINYGIKSVSEKKGVLQLSKAGEIIEVPLSAITKINVVETREEMPVITSDDKKVAAKTAGNHPTMSGEELEKIRKLKEDTDIINKIDPCNT